jgi:hypothetical protein
VRVVFCVELLAHRLDAFCAQGFTNALTSDQNTNCLQIRHEFTIGRVEGMAARFAEHRFLTALFTLRHDDFLVQILGTRLAMLPQRAASGKMESLRLTSAGHLPLKSERHLSLFLKIAF